MNLNNFKEGSSSCQCTLTLYGENEETEKIVFRILSMWQHTLKSSRKDVGPFWDLVARGSGTESMSANQTENGTRLPKT